LAHVRPFQLFQHAGRVALVNAKSGEVKLSNLTNGRS